MVQVPRFVVIYPYKAPYHAIIVAPRLHLCYGGVHIGLVVGAQDEEVYLQENILAGDPAYAEDISFQISSHWQEKLLWETSVDIGKELAVDTDFSFYPNGFDDSRFFIKSFSNFKHI